MSQNRRNFIKKASTGAAGIAFSGSINAMSAKSYSHIFGANDHINCALFGVHSRGKAHVKALHADGNAKLVYNCDVDGKILKEHSAWCQENIGYIPKTEKDFRKVLEDKDVDAIFIATPEHWHAPMAIMALQAGKHVYVEKPCSHNPYENTLLVEAQNKYGKKVQMGNQQRSANTSILAVKEIGEGIIGDVYKGEAYYSNNRGSIGTGNKIEVPPTLDWELWQGPAVREAYRDNIHPYNWHWFRSWGTGEVHNNGTHELDICRWAMGVDLPDSVTSVGGKYTFDDDWEFPDNQHIIYKFGGDKFITWNGHSRGVIKPDQPGRGASIYGSEGIITLGRDGYRLYDLGGKLIKEEKEGGGQSAGTNTRGEGDLDVNHVSNFFAAIRKDKSLHSDIQDASVSTMLCHLGNMAEAAGETIQVDSTTGKVTNNEKVMEDWWKRKYADGWEPSV